VIWFHIGQNCEIIVYGFCERLVGSVGLRRFKGFVLEICYCMLEMGKKQYLQ
jgi:hypothetical protein